MAEERLVYIPCNCGKMHTLTDPGRNVYLRCKTTGASLAYECRLGDRWRLRGKEKDIILSQYALEIGRAPKPGGVVLDQARMSRRHCRLHPTPGGFEIEDLGSSNGTFVNACRLKKGERLALVPGDLVRLGDCDLRFIGPQVGHDTESTVFETVPADATAEMQPVGAEEIDEETDKLIGKTLGGYEVIGTLGQGGFGKIYRARHMTMGRECVIKTVLPDMHTSREVMGRFLREIKLGAAINHPNVITFHDAGTEQGVAYLVMEYFEGKNLWRLYHNDPADIDKAVDIAIQASAGLAAGHALGVIHRDVKPDNILLGDDGMVKVIDFGLAKATRDERFNSITTGSCVIGSPAYMAPEQVDKPELIDSRTDIYGLGATLYFCLTATPPYLGSNPVAVVQAIGKKFTPPSDLRPDMPPELENVIRKSMEPKQKNRYDSAEQMAEALENVRAAL